MRTLTASALALLLTVTAALAGQAGITGHCNTARCSTIIWGGVGWLQPGANAHPYPIYIYGPGGLLHTVTTADYYFQFPKQSIGPGYVTWKTQAPADGLTDGPSITVQASPPVGAYWPPGYMPLPPGTGPSLADKDGYVQDAAGLALLAAATCFVVVAAAPAIVVTAASLIASGLVLLSFGFQTLAADPPDPHFEELASVASETPSLPLPAGAPTCNRAALGSEAAYIGLVRTMTVTANRISGAAAAHNSAWVSRQNSWYLHLRSQLPSVQASFQSSLQHWLSTCAPRHAAPTTTAVLAAERSWLNRGFPATLSAAFSQLGVSTYDAEEALIPASPAAVVGALQDGFR